MVYKGVNIRSNSDILSPISIEELYKSVHSFTSDLERLITTLRTIRRVDEKKYHTLKVQFPYFV